MQREMGTAVGRPKRHSEGKQPSPGKTIGLRVSPEYGAWIEGLADHYRTTVAGLIDRAVAEWAASQGYPHQPPRRTP